MDRLKQYKDTAPQWLEGDVQSNVFPGMLNDSVVYEPYPRRHRNKEA